MGVTIPEQVVSFIEPISNANSFLAMFMLGLMVQFSLGKGKVFQLVRLLGLRFLFSAVMSIGAMTLLPFDPVTRMVIAALLWSPMGALGLVYTLWAKGDVGLAGFANVVTVAVGIVSMTAAAMMIA